MRSALAGKCRLPLTQNGSNSHAKLPIAPARAWGRWMPHSRIMRSGPPKRSPGPDGINWLGDVSLVTRPSDADGCVPLCPSLRAPSDDWNETAASPSLHLQRLSMMPRTNRRRRLNLPHVLRDYTCMGSAVPWGARLAVAHANSQTPGHWRPTRDGSRMGVGSEMGSHSCWKHVATFESECFGTLCFFSVFLLLLCIFPSGRRWQPWARMPFQ